MNRRKLDIREIPESFYIINFINGIRINESNGCWEWKKSTHGNGYGAFCVRSKQVSPHIYIMMITGRYIDGLVVDHICRNTICCNPDHLRMVTHRTNAIENNSSPAFINANKTHCKYNHPFNEENTGFEFNKKTGKQVRKCLACKKERRKNSFDKYGYKT